jgi:hypothetical protein
MDSYPESSGHTVLKFLERITSSWRAQSGGPYAIAMCTYVYELVQTEQSRHLVKKI